MNVTHALFHRFIDYAGLFPPAQLAMPDAAKEYDSVRRGPFAWMSGRFIVPASRLDELCAAIGPAQPFACSVIVDAALDARTWLPEAAALVQTVARHREHSPAVSIEALEVPVPALVAARDTFDAAVGQCGMLVENAGLRGLPVYVELTRSPGRFEVWLPAGMAALARTRLHAKVRCGGTTPEAVPSAGELAAFVSCAHEHGVAWKATAGLHHPVRSAQMHGFLNLIAAALLARRGAARAALQEALEDADATAFGDDGTTFRYRGERFEIAQLAEMRKGAFHGYGSCSFSEPVDDLVALHLLERTGVAV